MFRFLQNSLNLSETNLLPASDIIFLGNLYSVKIIVDARIKLFTESLLDDWEFAVIIYNTNIVLTV